MKHILSQLEKDRSLYQNVYHNNYKEVKKWIDYGADVNTNISSFGESLIKRAIINNNYDIIALLMSYHIILQQDEVELLEYMIGKKKLLDHNNSIKAIKHVIDVYYKIPPGLDKYMLDFIIYDKN